MASFISVQGASAMDLIGYSGHDFAWEEAVR